MGLSQEGGHTLTPNPADADVLVVNTCAFIDSAKEESVNTILELAEFKKSGNCKRLVVTGCLGERYRDELKEQIPEIDAVLGTGDVPEIVGAIEGTSRIRTIPLRLVHAGNAYGELRGELPGRADREPDPAAGQQRRVEHVQAGQHDSSEVPGLRCERSFRRSYDSGAEHRRLVRPRPHDVRSTWCERDRRLDDA